MPRGTSLTKRRLTSRTSIGCCTRAQGPSSRTLSTGFNWTISCGNERRGEINLITKKAINMAIRRCCCTSSVSTTTSPCSPLSSSLNYHHPRYHQYRSPGFLIRVTDCNARLVMMDMILMGSVTPQKGGGICGV